MSCAILHAEPSERNGSRRCCVFSGQSAPARAIRAHVLLALAFAMVAFVAWSRAYLYGSWPVSATILAKFHTSTPLPAPRAPLVRAALVHAAVNAPKIHTRCNNH
jgi:hypothetical protein